MMSSMNPLLLVEDDFDDQEMIKLAFQDLGFNREIRIFANAEAALKFLYETAVKPFLIISDINLPKMDGLSFKGEIESCSVLREKCIPFVFLSTASSAMFIKKAYELKAQGFFEKGSTYSHLKDSLDTILDYWQKSKQSQP
jgi:CheY-like chemotaxis protein